VGDPDGLLDIAERVARAGGAELLARFRGPAAGVVSKSTPTDLVSAADHAAEHAIVSILRSERPRDAIVAEEGAGVEGDSGLRWLVDPLDGTTNYLWGIPQWCVSVAARDDAGGVVAVVHDPLREETFRARRGGGAWLDGTRLAVRRETPLAEALVGTGFNYSHEERARQADRLTALLPRVRDLRRFGAAALDLAWVAAGRIDAYFESGLAPWDWAAGELLVTEAGGIVRELPGGAGPPVLHAGPAALVAAITDAVGPGGGREPSPVAPGRPAR
jgi:myo-inositol-1(or 4)-monophosphatase